MLKRYSSIIYPSLSIIACIALWSFLTYSKLISPIFLPTPSQAFQAFITGIIDYSLVNDLLHTMVRFLAAFFIAVILGTPIGMLMGTSQKVFHSLEFLVEFFRSIPTTALFPLFLLFFGIGDVAKIAVAAWGAGLIIIVNTMYGVHNIKKLRLLVAENLKLSPTQKLKDIVFFDALPSIVAGYRVALSISLVIIIVTEMFIGSKSGLGLRIINDQLVYNTADMFSTILVTGILGFGSNKLLQKLESRFVHWKGK